MTTHIAHSSVPLCAQRYVFSRFSFLSMSLLLSFSQAAIEPGSGLALIKSHQVVAVFHVQFLRDEELLKKEVNMNDCTVVISSFHI